MPEAEAGEDLEQQEAELADKATEVVADSREDGVVGIALAVPEVVATHPMFGFEMADDRLDGVAARA